MIFLMPFHPADKTCAETTLRWVKELGGCKGHGLILMPAKKVFDFKTLHELAASSFDSVEILKDAEGIEGHPEGPNSMMRQAVWHTQMADIGPWTYWEPDCIPRDSGWADVWEREYRAYGKQFMGELREVNNHQYLTGNMVLPKGALRAAAMLSRRGLSIEGTELAFDIVAAQQVLPQAHLTKLLQQVPKNPDGSSHTFSDSDSLSLLREGAVLFHPCKDGSLIERLRAKKNGVAAPTFSANSVPVVSVYNDNRLLKDNEILTRENEILRAEIERLSSKLGIGRTEVKQSKISAINGNVAQQDRLLAARINAQRIKPKRTAAEQKKINDRMAKARAARKQKAAA